LALPSDRKINSAVPFHVTQAGYGCDLASCRFKFFLHVVWRSELRFPQARHQFPRRPVCARAHGRRRRGRRRFVVTPCVLRVLSSVPLCVHSTISIKFPVTLWILRVLPSVPLCVHSTVSVKFAFTPWVLRVLAEGPPYLIRSFPEARAARATGIADGGDDGPPCRGRAGPGRGLP
jgi:hypothetical protein